MSRKNSRYSRTKYIETNTCMQMRRKTIVSTGEKGNYFLVTNVK